MMSFRFPDREQKELNLTILQDLLKDNADDQLARTALSNAIAMASATLVPGELDEMMKRTERMMSRTSAMVSVFFGILFVAQLAMGYYVTWGNYIAAVSTVVYAVCIWYYVRIQRRYHDTIRWLESMQMELPSAPLSLVKPH